MGWQTPPVMANLQNGAFTGPEGLKVAEAQSRLVKATLAAVGRDVCDGLLETVGIKSSLVEGEHASVVLELPSETDTALIARAISMENVESWCDPEGRVHVAISPWYSTKDVDQVVLSTTKVVHVLLGLHASDAAPPKSFIQRVLASAREIVLIQKRQAERKDSPIE